MKMYRCTLTALMLTGALFGAHAESFKDVHPEFADMYAAQIEAQSDLALDRMQLDIGGQVEETRIAFVREQGNAIIEQGNNALFALQNDLVPNDVAGEKLARAPSSDEVDIDYLMDEALLVDAY